MYTLLTTDYREVQNATILILVKKELIYYDTRGKRRCNKLMDSCSTRLKTWHHAQRRRGRKKNFFLGAEAKDDEGQQFMGKQAEIVHRIKIIWGGKESLG